MRIHQEMPDTEPRGFKIRTFNYVVITIACVLYALLVYETIAVKNEYNELNAYTQEYNELQQDAFMVSEGSDYLTEQVRLYTVMADVKYVDNYFEEVDVTRRRDIALEELGQHAVSDAARVALASALSQSNYLMEREIYAMRLIAEATDADLSTLHPRVQQCTLHSGDARLSDERKIDLAQQIVFDNSYLNVKANIDNSVQRYLGEVLNGAENRWSDAASELSRLLTEQRICISVLFVLTVLNFVVITMLIIRPLTIYISCIKDDRLFEIIGAYEFKYLALTYNSIYELNAANEAILSKQASTDFLTGVINRGTFSQLCDIMRGSREPVGLLIADVDDFKSINDTYGHEVGDKVLQKVAGMLSTNFRSTDTAARLGGDEFAVLLSNLSTENGRIVRDKIANINDTLMHPDDGLPPVSLSVGVSLSERGFTDDMYSQADKALYKVKQAGRNGCAFFGE